MRISIGKVADLNPCADRFNNFKDNNPGFDGTLAEFLNLDSITYNDKVWVCVRLMSHNQKFQWAVACAASVLEIFEAKYPNNKAPRLLLERLRKVKDVTKLTAEERAEILTLRNAAYAAYAAYAAAYAAYAAYADAAAYAAAAAAADADAADAADAREIQRNLNLILLQQVIDEVE